MKKLLFILVCAFTILSVSAQTATSNQSSTMNQTSIKTYSKDEGIQKAKEYLDRTGMFFMATADDDQPKCRPLGFKLLIDNKLYFAVGDFKDVYKQMVKNPKVEICASDGHGFLRMYGTAVFESDYTIAEKALEGSGLRSIYNEETGHKLMVFHLENGCIEFRGMMEVEAICDL